MLPVHDEHGDPAGFIGRARPGTGPNVPKYLNGPATSTYQKGDLLFGLYRARDQLARGATPVITEGPSTRSPSPWPARTTTPDWPPAAPP